MTKPTQRLVILVFLANAAGCGFSSNDVPTGNPPGSEPSADAMADVGSQLEASLDEASMDHGTPVADGDAGTAPGSDATPVVDSTADTFVPMNDAQGADSDVRAGWQLVWNDEFNDPAGT